MATYKNWLTRADGTPILGAQACLYNKEGVRLDVDITEEEGLFYFLNVATGHYQVRFFGLDLTEADWWEIDVIDELPTGSGIVYDPIIFTTYPNITVSEGDTRISEKGEITQALYTIDDVDTTQGKVAQASIYIRQDGTFEWKLLDNLNLDYGSSNTDLTISTITGMSEIELTDKPTLYHFKAEFFNPVGEIALLDEVIVSPITSNLFNGINDVGEYIGVTNLIAQNIVLAKDEQYYTCPTEELLLTWDQMKTVSSSTQFYNALGQPVTLTSNELRNITGYVVFMFISNSGKPSSYPWPYPTSDIYGTWYYINNVPTNRTMVRLPKSKFCQVWVGFKTIKTDDTSVIDKLEVTF